jgi:ubiquinone/menaquinone biosynthesis C-methylase UbiE
MWYVLVQEGIDADIQEESIMGLLKIGKLYNNIGRGNKSTRDAWIQKALMQIPAGSKILDAGAGELQYKQLCAHLEYVSQDCGQYNGKGDSRGLQTSGWDNAKLDIVSDITSIPVPDASFDVIMCIEVLEHIPKPILAIKEFNRILRGGGTMILTAPVCSLTHFAPYYFYNGYSRYFYERILRESGFEIEELTNNGNWYEYIAQELHRLPYMLNKYSGVKYASHRLLSVMIRLALLPLYIVLSWASSRDNGSSELLSFGIHVMARKC